MSENPYATPQTKVEIKPPLPRHPAQGSPYGPYRNNQTLAVILIILFSLNIVLVIASVISSFLQLDSGLPSDLDASSLMSEIDLMITLAEVICFLLLIIFWCVWANRSCKNAWLINSRDGATAIYRGRTSFTPGWTVGWFFVPVALLWKPFEAMCWIRDASQKTMGLRMGKLLGLWWTFWILNRISSQFIQGLFGNAYSSEEFLSAHRLYVVFGPLGALAAIFALLVVHRLTKIQKIRAQELNLI